MVFRLGDDEQTIRFSILSKYQDDTDNIVSKEKTFIINEKTVY